MHLHTVAIDVDSVRAQLALELNRAVSDVEVCLWLERCGFVQKDGRWISTHPRHIRLGSSHPNLPPFLASA